MIGNHSQQTLASRTRRNSKTTKDAQILKKYDVQPDHNITPLKIEVIDMTREDQLEIDPDALNENEKKKLILCLIAN